MLRGSKGPVIQVDRLIFDTRNKAKKNSIIPDVFSSLNRTNKETISTESHIFISSNKLQIIRLTFEDLNNDEKKIYSIGQQSSSSVLQKTIAEKDEDILSPVYESIDERQDSIDLIKKETQFEMLY